MAVLIDRKRQIGAQQMVVGAGEPDVGQKSAFEIEPPAVGQRDIRVKANAKRLPGVILNNGGDTGRNAARANIRIGCGLLAPEGFHPLMQIVVADKAIDAEIGAAQ